MTSNGQNGVKIIINHLGVKIKPPSMNHLKSDEPVIHQSEIQLTNQLANEIQLTSYSPVQLTNEIRLTSYSPLDYGDGFIGN